MIHFLKLDICKNTLRNAFHREGIFKFRCLKKKSVSLKDRRQRVQWCEEHLEWPLWKWKETRFAD